MTDLVQEQLTAEQARSLTDRIVRSLDEVGESLDDLASQVNAAFMGRAWASMDYPSWESYCEASFGSRLRGLVTADRGALVGAMHGGSMSTRAIAKALHVGRNTIRKDLNERQRQVAPSDPPGRVAQVALAPPGDSDDAPVDAEIVPPPTPARVTGTDGKSYSAAQPIRPAPAPAPSVHVKPAQAPDVAPLQAEIARLTAEVARLTARSEPMPAEARPCTRCSGKGWLTKADAAPATRGGRALISPKDCVHPPGSRIGDDCMVCGVTITRKAGR